MEELLYFLQKYSGLEEAINRAGELGSYYNISGVTLWGPKRLR